METGYFKFGGDVKPSQNNFCGLGTVGGGARGAHFLTPQLGVRAHVQHLMAYTSAERPRTEIIDPRYDVAHNMNMQRGLSTTWSQLNGRWAMASNYAEKIFAIFQLMEKEPTSLTNSSVVGRKGSAPADRVKAEKDSQKSKEEAREQRRREREQKKLQREAKKAREKAQKANAELAKRQRTSQNVRIYTDKRPS